MRSNSCKVSRAAILCLQEVDVLPSGAEAMKQPSLQAHKQQADVRANAVRRGCYSRQHRRSWVQKLCATAACRCGSAKLTCKW